MKYTNLCMHICWLWLGWEGWCGTDFHSLWNPSSDKTVKELGKVCSSRGDGLVSGQVIARSQKNDHIGSSVDGGISDLHQQVASTGTRNRQETDRKICWGVHNPIRKASQMRSPYYKYKLTQKGHF
ncbi:hypothetical protein EYF80_009849 [Liparis tanakae]|uniref:Uncharacterized protein n=1 Tax=Liparis tanakae TaxID=230148 RepID=A0A4Z2IRF1_9TELE|nr:hypothetical protein EYF80_009849 [Liparis tanakae]